MVLKKVSHIVTRPGRITGSSDAEIPVAEDLATVPGVPLEELIPPERLEEIDDRTRFAGGEIVK